MTVQGVGQAFSNPKYQHEYLPRAFPITDLEAVWPVLFFNPSSVIRQNVPANCGTWTIKVSAPSTSLCPIQFDDLYLLTEKIIPSIFNHRLDGKYLLPTRSANSLPQKATCLCRSFPSPSLQNENLLLKLAALSPPTVFHSVAEY